ncbi:MAG: SUMF1/EgtB/PvdO family nonheme iron enzyme [Dehalococcoidia bacterium]|nr:SUMF1/EgtB/PvdO family nonheme iron enzyme [Dehalococcoidia bacterium]
MALIPAGSFVMGNDAGRPDERPAHRVTLAAFRAAVRPVSNAEYALFLSATGHEPPPFLDDERFNAPEQPVVGVIWAAAVAYCRWLASRTRLAFRLPAEAEREYASLGGLTGADWPWGNEAPSERQELREIAHREQPHAPGAECVNGYGLLCTADNVHEWCSDWYGADYYAESPEESPQGPRTGKRRSSRGGSWRHQLKFNRLSSRSSLDPSFCYNDYGFRVYEEVEA